MAKRLSSLADISARRSIRVSPATGNDARRMSSISALTPFGRGGTKPGRKVRRDRDSSDSVASTESTVGSITRTTAKRKEEEKENEGFRQQCCHLVFQILCLLHSRMFIRHRYRVFLIIEVFFPVIITCGIVAAFTSGISWKQAYFEKKLSDSVKPSFPGIPMDDYARAFGDTVDTAIERFNRRYTDAAGSLLLLYAPNTTLINNLMRKFVKDNLKLDPSQNRIDETGMTTTGVVGFPDAVGVVEHALYHKNEQRGHGKPVGIVFDYEPNNVVTKNGYPRIMSFSIRHFEEEVSATKERFPYQKPIRTSNTVPRYVDTGILGLQYAIEHAYFESLAIHILNSTPGGIVNSSSGAQVQHFVMDTNGNLLNVPAIRIQMYYFPNYFNGDVRHLQAFTVTTCIVVAYMFASFFFVRQLALEKKSGIRELLVLHGLSKGAHWVVYVLHALLFRGITAVLQTCVLMIDFGHGSVISLSDISLIFCIIWIHLMALTFFDYFIAVFISSGSVTFVGVYSVLLCFASFLLPYCLFSAEILNHAGNIILSLLFPNWAFYNILYGIVDYECDDKGAHWKNLDVKYENRKTDHLSIQEAFILMGFSGLMYLILAILDDLSGHSKMFPQVLQWWNCMGRRKQKKENKKKIEQLKEDLKDGQHDNFEATGIYEPTSFGKKCHIRLRGLCKRHGKHKMALDTINLNIMHREITVILGKGGSGKSTLIGILAGIISPSAGFATVNNHDVMFESRHARRHVGLSPQSLIFMNVMNVRDHIFFLYRLRKYPIDECNRNTSTLLTRLRLWNLRYYYPDNMTNDELRRLSIAMALVDSPKILLLDEPTNGMDAFGRREIWGILKALKPHHTIVLTSNYLDEAEYLATTCSAYIALMAQGRLVCYGSLRFLKRQYETGYFLRCQPSPDKRVDSDELIKLVQSTVGELSEGAESRFVKDVDAVIVELPNVELLKYAELCDILDANAQKLGIGKYSFKQIGLNDIFTKLSESVSDSKDVVHLLVRRDSAGDIRTALASQLPPMDDINQKSEAPNLYLQFTTLVRKRINYIISTNEFFVWQVLIPLILVVIVMLEAKRFVVEPEVPPPRNMSLNEFCRAQKGDCKIFVRVLIDDKNINYTARFREILGNRYEYLDKSRTMLSALQSLTTLDDNGNKDIGTIKEQHLCAVELEEDRPGSFRISGYFASGALHSAPIIINEIMNVLLHAIQPLDKTPYRIYAMNHPLPFVMESWSSLHPGCGLVCVIFAGFLSFALAFISSSFTIFPMDERKTGMKDIQIETGVDPIFYWVGTFVCDAILMIIVSIIVAIIFSIKSDIFTVEAIVLLAIFLALYLAWSGLAFSYLASTILSKKYRPFMFCMVFHFLVCIMPFLLIESAAGPQGSAGSTFFRVIFMILPGFALTCTIEDWFITVERQNICNGLPAELRKVCDPNVKHVETKSHFNSEAELFQYIIKENPKFAQCCERICAPSKSCYTKAPVLDTRHPFLIVDITMLILLGFIYWALLWAVERRFFSKLGGKISLKFLESDKGAKLRGEGRGSIEVKMEESMVNSIMSHESLPPDTALVIHELTKSTTTGMIVNNVNLEIKKGECIGILGSGGSGKSTLLRMIAGLELPTKGNCYIGKYSLKKNRADYLSSIGFCPQGNSLFESFTGIQMLELVGRLRGVPEHMLTSHVAKWLTIMGLRESAKDKCSSYGLDMRRCLSVALCLIGQRPILILDEPTNDMNPAARETFWAVLEHLKELGHTIIFSTFHIEECVMLATKMIVLSEGNVQSLGAPDTIKSKYAKGYCLTFRIRHEMLSFLEVYSATMGRVSELKKAITRIFMYCDILDEQDNILLFFLRDSRIPWTDVFQRLHELYMEYFSILEGVEVNEASVEDLFVFLTNKYTTVSLPRRQSLESVTSLTQQEEEIRALEKAAKGLHMKV